MTYIKPHHVAEECQYENIPTSCPCLYFSDTLTLCIMELPLYNANLLLRRFILSRDPLLYRYTIVYARLSALYRLLLAEHGDRVRTLRHTMMD